MKKSKMILEINSMKKFGLVLLLLMSFSIYGNGNTHAGKMDFATVATNVVASQAEIGADVAKKTDTKTAVATGDYDKIDSEFDGIGPGNNTLPFIIAFVILLLGFGAIKKLKGKGKLVAALATILALAYVAKITYTEARALGRQQGYAPVQPIWFSHKVHATQNGIDCEYCHVDARTSRHAGVPSLNVCMNCHNQVKEGSVSGKKEIAKIYDHLGYNPTTMQYDKPGKPIEWVKVHNLPDHVYFNHSQHVQAGKVKCQECHGPVEKMNRVVEYKEFAMGDFCLDCHRKRGIDTSNPYYKHYKFKNIKEGEKITVDKIGGDDCSSCHY